MNALEFLNTYLQRMERRLRFGELSRGLGLVAAAALVATVLLVLFANQFAFSSPSVTGARVALFLVLAFVLALCVVLPLLRLNRQRAARRAEQVFPEFEQRLLTLAEARQTGAPEPFLELMAQDAMPIVEHAEPHRVITTGRIAGFLAGGAAAAGVLLWLTLAGPGFLGYGSSLLWGGVGRHGDQPFYDIQVTPGDKTVRRGGDQLVSAHLLGLQAAQVRLFARFESTSKWEETEMQPQPGGTGFEFLFAGLPEAVDYYIEAGAVRTPKYRLSVVDLPKVQSIQVTYRYPKWLGTEDLVEEDAGDLRAVEGTEAELLVETDKPLNNGRLLLDDGSEIALEGAGNLRFKGVLKIEKDGLYHVAVIEQDERVRLTEDYFIEAQRENVPTVRIRRPGRDYRANPVEEVTIQVEAEDDFGLRDLSVRYSVNGGEEQTIPLLKQRGADQANGSAVLYLEDHNLVPGDLVSLYAVARDARASSQTDMFFIEAQPFEREYSQAQQAGGMGMGGEQDQNQISARQKEIISATWNIIKDSSRTRAQLAEDAKFLSDVQSKLKAQAESLARRMRARQLSMANEEFEMFAQNMEAAAREMDEAATQLSGLQWKPALTPEQKALQHLLRAESIFRKIQVAQGSRGGGGGGGNMGRDLENLFDLELDRDKNQYETGQQASMADQQSKEIDEALQKLEELARRQQELAEQQRRNEQSFQQRWQQEMLRREAEELKRQMEELARRTDQLQRGQQSSQQQGSQQQGSQQQQSSASGSAGSAGDARLQQAIERLRQATEDMRRASSNRNDPNQRDAESRRAAERLQEATEMLSGMRREESTEQLSSIAERAERLAEQQRGFADKLRDAYKDHKAITGQPSLGQAGPDPSEIAKLAEEKQGMAEDLQRLEKDMQSAVRDLAAGQKGASSKLREALGDMQQNELNLRMKYLSEWIRRGLGAYAWLREAPVTEGLNRLAEQTSEAQQAVGEGDPEDESLEQALARVERLRAELEEMARGARQDGQRGQSSDQQGQANQQGNQQGQQPGQQGQSGQQGQQGQSGQQGGQQPGGQPGQGPNQGRMFGQQQYGGDGSGRTYSAMNMGDRDANLPNRPVSPEQLRGIEQAYREGLRDLSSLRGSVRENDEVASEVAELIRQMQGLDPSRFRGNPELVEQLRTQVLPGLEQLELRLRRELEGDAGTQVKSVLSRPVPPGYADAVAEYYRKLSEGR